MSGSKNGAADALSRRGYCEEDGELLDDDAVDNFFDAKMYSVMVEPTDNVSVDVEILRVHLNGRKYEGEHLVLGKCLSTLQRPDGLTDLEYQRLRKNRSHSS